MVAICVFISLNGFDNYKRTLSQQLQCSLYVEMLAKVNTNIIYHSVFVRTVPHRSFSVWRGRYYLHKHQHLFPSHCILLNALGPVTISDKTWDLVDSKPQDCWFKSTHRTEVWQPRRQQCCRLACQILERLGNAKYECSAFLHFFQFSEI